METTACLVGGGPAGLMLGLLLSRAGVEVTVLEKHADFLRDFRGDTVHPATLDVLDELGLAESFHRLPHRKVSTIGIVHDGRRSEMADFRMLRARYPYIAFIPQWDFLTFIAEEASRQPTFRLRMRTAADDVIREGARVAGVHIRDPDGEDTIRAGLTIAADGRHSTIRGAAGLAIRRYGTPYDTILFRVTRRDSDPDEGLCVRVGAGAVFGLAHTPHRPG